MKIIRTTSREKAMKIVSTFLVKGRMCKIKKTKDGQWEVWVAARR